MAKKPVKSKKIGAPTKYREVYCDKLVAHMEKGYSFETFAVECDVDVQTLYNWVKSQPAFFEAKKRAFLKNRLFWERVGIQGTVGNLQGWNPTGWIFNMKNRFSWQDRKEPEDTNKIHTVQIELPGQKTQQVISMEPKKIEGKDDVE